MDRRLIEEKLESLRRCLERVRQRCPPTAEMLEKDPDAQDIVTLNLTRAIQLCVDIGAHLITNEPVPPPTTMGETFDLLARTGHLEPDLGRRLKQAVGSRNIAIHNYEVIDWAIVHGICRDELSSFDRFARAVAQTPADP